MASNPISRLGPWIFAGLGVAFIAVFAIVVINERLASTPTDNPPPAAVDGDIQLPPLLAGKLQGPAANAEAFDTPFFNAAKEPITLTGLQGRGVVLNFWATWCVPCVREMPDLDRLAQKLSGTGVDVIALSQDRQPFVKVPPFYAERGIENLDLYYDEQGELARNMDVGGLPTTVLIDAQGREIGRVLGVLAWDEPSVVNYLVERLGPAGDG